VYRSALSPSLLVAIALFTSVPLRSQETSSACGLLQVGELEAALGGKASTKPAGFVQAVPGMTLDQCSVVLSASGTTLPVDIRIASKLGMDGAQAITIRNTGTARETQWKVAGARLEQATVGNAICILTGRPSVASHSICSVPRGEGFVELDVTGPVGALPSLATVGALVQKAVSRL
jgi:hypothetical protein